MTMPNTGGSGAEQAISGFMLPDQESEKDKLRSSLGNAIMVERPNVKVHCFCAGSLLCCCFVSKCTHQPSNHLAPQTYVAHSAVALPETS